MYYGELAEKGNDYYNGYMKAVNACYCDCMVLVKALYDEKKPLKPTSKDIVDAIIRQQDNFIEFCNTYGMGKGADYD